MPLDRFTCSDHQHYDPFFVHSALPRIPRECARELKLCVAVGVTKLKEVDVPAGRKDGGSVGMWKPS